MITKDENAKIRHLLAAIESMNGVLIPFPTRRKISDVYAELKAFLNQEEVEQ